MSDLVTLYNPTNSLVSCLEETEKNGRNLYNTNDTYKSIANVMEHPEFRTFFNKNFSDWDDVKTILMFLKLYQEIETSFPAKLNGYQKISILDSLIKNKDIRRDICSKFSKCLKESNKITMN